MRSPTSWISDWCSVGRSIRGPGSAKGCTTTTPSPACPRRISKGHAERDLPVAFFRRCLRLAIADTDEPRLRRVVDAHLDKVDTALLNELIAKFLAGRQGGGTMATDQLLNALFLLSRDRPPLDDEREAV